MIGWHAFLNCCQDSLRSKSVVPYIRLSSFFVYEQVTELIPISIVTSQYSQWDFELHAPMKKCLKIDQLSLTEEW